MAQIAASDAMMKVLVDWGVKNIYGLPGGSFDSTMNAIYNFRDQIKYIGVRHEEVGALAAVAEGKLTGKIGVTFGSAGPGAAHLLNGLYDAKTDRIPTLALVAQVPSSVINTDMFQEIDEKPMFDDVAVYNRVVMTAEQLPFVVDAAIRAAYENQGVAVVIIPKDFGWAKIEDDYQSSANSYVHPEWDKPARDEDITKALDLIAGAERPIFYVGRGAAGVSDELVELAHTLKMPIVSSYLSKGNINEFEEAYMLSTGRVSSKPGVDAARAADLVVYLGTNYEFPSFDPNATFIDVNLRPSVIGARHDLSLGILADAKSVVRQLLEQAKNRNDALSDRRVGWWDAALENRKQWRDWLASRENDESTPIRFEPIYAELNKVADPDAIFGVDVGNVNIAVARYLNLYGGRRQVTSPLYATMGFGLPAGIAAKLAYPEREVWTLSGDGGMAMVVPDIITMKRYNLPVINVVFTNSSLGYIEAEQDDTHQPHSGVDLSPVDFAKVAEGFGVKGYTVHSPEEWRQVLAEVKGTQEPVLIDVKITNDRQLPVEAFPHNASDRDDFDEFRKEYGAEALEAFADILGRHVPDNADVDNDAANSDGAFADRDNLKTGE